MGEVDTLVICDGGSRDTIGFHAGYELVNGRESIAYSIDVGVNSKFIQRMYIYTDCKERVLDIARKHFADRLHIIDDCEPFPMTHEQKVLRIVPAELKMAASFHRTFYQYIVNDRNDLSKFTGNPQNYAEIRDYRMSEPLVKELAIAAMANDMPHCRQDDLDALIEAYNPAVCDTLAGYTKKGTLDDYLDGTGLSVENFHHTLGKNDFINGEWMRHNCLWVTKWSKLDDRLADFISYFNQHRYQSKMVNLMKVAAKLITTYLRLSREVFTAIGDCMLFVVGKYLDSFGSDKVRGLVTKRVNNETIRNDTGNLLGHRICIYDKSSARPLIDIDAPTDVPLIERIMEIKKEY